MIWADIVAESETVDYDIGMRWCWCWMMTLSWDDVDVDDFIVMDVCFVLGDQKTIMYNLMWSQFLQGVVKIGFMLDFALVFLMSLIGVCVVCFYCGCLWCVFIHLAYCCLLFCGRGQGGRIKGSNERHFSLFSHQSLWCVSENFAVMQKIGNVVTFQSWLDLVDHVFR